MFFESLIEWLDGVLDKFQNAKGKAGKGFFNRFAKEVLDTGLVKVEKGSELVKGVHVGHRAVIDVDIDKQRVMLRLGQMVWPEFTDTYMELKKGAFYEKGDVDRIWRKYEDDIRGRVGLDGQYLSTLLSKGKGYKVRGYEGKIGHDVPVVIMEVSNVFDLAGYLGMYEDDFERRKEMVDYIGRMLERVFGARKLSVVEALPAPRDLMGYWEYGAWNRAQIKRALGEVEDKADMEMEADSFEGMIGSGDSENIMWYVDKYIELMGGHIGNPSDEMEMDDEEDEEEGALDFDGDGDKDLDLLLDVEGLGQGVVDALADLYGIDFHNEDNEDNEDNEEGEI